MDKTFNSRMCKVMLVKVPLTKFLVRAIIKIGKTRNKIVQAEMVAKNALLAAVVNISLVKIKAHNKARTTTACVNMAQVEELIDPTAVAPPTSKNMEVKAAIIQTISLEELIATVTALEGLRLKIRMFRTLANREPITWRVVTATACLASATPANSVRTIVSANWITARAELDLTRRLNDSTLEVTT